MHQTLDRFVTPTAAKTLSDVYNRISTAYVRRPGDDSLKTHLESVRKTLAETRKATGIEFLCFRARRERNAGKISAASSRDEAGSMRNQSRPRRPERQEPKGGRNADNELRSSDMRL